MNAETYVRELAKVKLQGVFNPYSNRCGIYDLKDGPAVRCANLREYLSAVEASSVDTVWMGRDLGYRGGRRTGIALTDEVHLNEIERHYGGARAVRATRGPAVAERTAAEVWTVLKRLKRPPLLWNVFPLHPYEPADPLSNRKFTAAELAKVGDLNAALLSWLGIRRIVALGQDAARYGAKFGLEVVCIRHPSYGGVREFREGIAQLYGAELLPHCAQTALF